MTRSAVPDPTVARSAAALTFEAEDAINARVRGGKLWFEAREEVLAERQREWRYRFGAEAANIATRHILSMQPGELLTADTKATQRRQFETHMEGHLRSVGKWNWVNRATLCLFGLPLY